jgi:hypothetical protein
VSLVPHEWWFYSTIRPATLESLSLIPPGPYSGEIHEDQLIGGAFYLFIAYAPDHEAEQICVDEVWAPNGYDKGLRHIIHPNGADERPSWAKPWGRKKQKYSAS